MRPRQINYLRHPFSARQALAVALECWSESKSLPIMLITPKACAEDVAKNIRVILSKERKYSRSKESYGFVTSDIFPYTDEGFTGEATIISWRLTPLQNLRNLGILTPALEAINGH